MMSVSRSCVAASIILINVFPFPLDSYKRKAVRRNKSEAYFEFVKVYRNLPALWKVESDDYSDRNKKLKSQETLQQKYETAVYVLFLFIAAAGGGTAAPPQTASVVLLCSFMSFFFSLSLLAEAQQHHHSLHPWLCAAV